MTSEERILQLEERVSQLEKHTSQLERELQTKLVKAEKFVLLEPVSKPLKFCRS